MATFVRRSLLTAGILVAVTSAGCNMMALPFFLIPSFRLEQPKCKLASEDKEKQVRVMILAEMGLETQPDLVHFDGELARLLAHNMQEGFKSNKEKVTIVSTSKVERYKDDHPNWQSESATELGKHFHADYVIELEVGALSLFEKGSANQLYQGRISISMKVIDVHASGDNIVKYEEEYHCSHPQCPKPVGDNDLAQFKQKFLAVVAQELAWRFVAHPFDDETDMKNR